MFKKQDYDLTKIYFIESLRSEWKDLGVLSLCPQVDLCTKEEYRLFSQNLDVYKSMFYPRLTMVDEDDASFVLERGYIKADMNITNDIMNMVVWGRNGKILKNCYVVEKYIDKSRKLPVLNLYTLKDLFDAIKKMGVDSTGINDLYYRELVNDILTVFVNDMYIYDIKGKISEKELKTNVDEIMSFAKHTDIIYGGWQRKRD